MMFLYRLRAAAGGAKIPADLRQTARWPQTRRGQRPAVRASRPLATVDLEAPARRAPGYPVARPAGHARASARLEVDAHVLVDDREGDRAAHRGTAIARGSRCEDEATNGRASRSRS